MTLTKADLEEAIYNQQNLSRNKSVQIVEGLLEYIKSTLESGEDIMISGFGKFCVKEKGARRGRNPASGENLILDARRVVVFRCSPVLRDKINGKQ